MQAAEKFLILTTVWLRGCIGRVAGISAGGLHPQLLSY